ncbi:MAG: tRNA-dihydrouridine synthase [Microgenomates group bacterium]
MNDNLESPQSAFFNWSDLSVPIIGLSPMDGVTDHTYRHIQKKYGNPAVVYTEFTSVEGVCHGADRLLKDFLFDETQRPIIAQVYGTTPDFFRQTATLLCELGFDGIDVNMGCPAKNVAHSGAGAALINTPQLAQEIVRATKAGVTDWLHGKTARNCENITPEIALEVEKRHSNLPLKYQQKRQLPVSVKTRVGFDRLAVNDWIPALLEVEPNAIAIHGRTLKQQYSGFADWDAIGKAVEISKKSNCIILGNGDVHTLQEAREKVRDFGVDGVLIGRATFGNPYVFKEKIELTDPSRFEIALEHCRLFESVYGKDDRYNFLPMRKHLGWYIKDIYNARQIRIEVFQANCTADVENIFSRYELV